MTLLRRILAGVRGLFHKARIEREMDEELRGLPRDRGRTADAGPA